MPNAIDILMSSGSQIFSFFSCIFIECKGKEEKGRFEKFEGFEKFEKFERFDKPFASFASQLPITIGIARNIVLSYPDSHRDTNQRMDYDFLLKRIITTF